MQNQTCDRLEITEARNNRRRELFVKDISKIKQILIKTALKAKNIYKIIKLNFSLKNKWRCKHNNTIDDEGSVLSFFKLL